LWDLHLLFLQVTWARNAFPRPGKNIPPSRQKLARSLGMEFAGKGPAPVLLAPDLRVWVSGGWALLLADILSELLFCFGVDKLLLKIKLIAVF
jgi:hypothetical protein